MSKYANAFGSMTLQIYDLEGLIESYIIEMEEEYTGDLKNELAIRLLEEALGVRYEVEEPEGVFHFTTESGFTYIPEEFSEIARYANGVAEFNFPDTGSFEPESTSIRVYLNEGRIYEDKPDVIWHPPIGMDLNALGYCGTRDLPVNKRLEKLGSEYETGVYDVLYTKKEAGKKIHSGATGPYRKMITLAYDMAKNANEKPVLIRDQDGKLVQVDKILKVADKKKGR